MASKAASVLGSEAQTRAKTPINRRVLSIVLAAVVGVAALTYGVSRLVPAQTSATVTLRLQSGYMDAFLTPAPIDPAYLRVDASAAKALPTAMDAVRLLPSPPTTVAAFTARAMSLSRSLRVVTNVNDGNLSLTATNRSPQLARLTVLAFAQALLALRRAQSVSQIRAAVDDLRVTTRSAPPHLRARLDQQIGFLNATLAGDGDQTEAVLAVSGGNAGVNAALIALALVVLACAVFVVAGRNGRNGIARDVSPPATAENDQRAA